MTKNQGYDAKKYAEMTGFSGDWRDSWWNQDYLELLARRWDLGETRSILDVGCGAGHWGQRLATLVEEPVLTGVDHEAGFLQMARDRAAKSRGSFRYVEGTAEALPFDDDSFDLVTCQTVLMHVADAEVALREMIRVTRPGGLIVAAEPNNRINRMVSTAGLPPHDLEDTLRLLRFDDVCIRGKIALGHGDVAVGERLAHLFVRAGLHDMRVSNNDRCAWLLPPYETETEQGHIEILRQEVATPACRWGDYERAQNLYVAGGGDVAEFDELFSLDVQRQQEVLADIDAARHVWGGAFVMYVASGRKAQG